MMVMQGGIRKGGSTWMLLRQSRRQWKSTRAVVSDKAKVVSSSNISSSSQKHEELYWNKVKLMSVGSICGLVGFGLGSSFVNVSDDDEQQRRQRQRQRQLPSGVPSACCSCEDDDELSMEERQSRKLLVEQLESICGVENVISKELEKKVYCQGARIGKDGKALAVVTPSSLRQVVKCLQVIVDANGVILPQGANTGLTGGSTPRASSSQERPLVIINMKKHLNAFFPIDGGKRVVCLAGAGIADLSAAMKPWGFPNRESHSILGSTFLNPTVAAGVAYGSGGTQLRKGPAYTDRALYVKIDQDKWGNFVLNVVNTLGIDGLQDSDFHSPEVGSALEQLDIYAQDVRGQYQRAMASSSSDGLKLKSSNADHYKHKITTFTGSQANQVNRYNADTSGTDINRSEGKVFILATVHDTFETPKHKQSLWISFDNLQLAYHFRQQVALHNVRDLPVSMEYMNQDSIDVINSSGAVLANLITTVGINSPLIGFLWNIKCKVEALPFTWAPTICDSLLYTFNSIMPSILPPPIQQMTKDYSHHVAITVGDWDQNEMDHFQQRLQTFLKQHGGDDAKIKVYSCQNSKEEEKLSAFRFVAAPAFRTWCIGNHLEGFSVDYALPHQYTQVPNLAQDDKNIAKRMRYSHFGCNVVHEDVALNKGVHDVEEAKFRLKKVVEQQCQGKLPAEHGHGTEYKAPTSTQNRWKQMDPFNVLNPGIGGTSSKPKYQQ